MLYRSVSISYGTDLHLVSVSSKVKFGGDSRGKLDY